MRRSKDDRSNAANQARALRRSYGASKSRRHVSVAPCLPCIRRFHGEVMRNLAKTSTVTTVVLLIALPALAQSLTRVRGIITAVDGGRITVRERDGGAVTLNTDGKTSYAYVVPSSINDIKANDFIGAAVKGPSSALVAVEVALIPED